MATEEKQTHAERALQLLKDRGALRTRHIADALGITIIHASDVMNKLSERGAVVSCEVLVPGTKPSKEYRISAAAENNWKSFQVAGKRPQARAAAPADKPKATAQEGRKKPRKARSRPVPKTPHPRDQRRQKAVAPARRALSPDPSPAGGRGETSAFRCGLFSTGHLELVLRDGSRVELPPEDTRDLCDYLDKTLQEAA